MAKERHFNYQAWTQEITRISLVDLDIYNMAPGKTTENITYVQLKLCQPKLSLLFVDVSIQLPAATNSRITTNYGVLTCAKRIIEKGWDQTSGFIWKLRSQADWQRSVSQSYDIVCL